MSNVRNVNVHDSSGTAINSLGNALNIHDADVHHSIVNRQFDNHPGTATTFAVAAAAGDTSITLTSATGFAIGSYLHLYSATYQENHHVIITNLVGTVATLDRPLDYSYAIGDSIELSLINMAVVGTLAAPVAFTVKPFDGEIMHLTRILIEMTHTTAGDNGLFGDLAALTNGVVLRRYDGTTGLYSTFTNWKVNSDLVTDMYDVVYSARSGGGGAYGTNGRGTFSNAGAIIYLDGAAGDWIEILVQDDISSLTSFRIKAQGHLESY